jgi:hypothetical protein
VFHHLPQIVQGAIAETLLGQGERKNLLGLRPAGVGKNGTSVEPGEIFRGKREYLAGQTAEVFVRNFQGIHGCREFNHTATRVTKEGS